MAHRGNGPSDKVRRDADEAPPRELGPLFAATVISFSVLLWLIVVFQAAFLMPKCEKIFSDFKMRTPWLTEQMMHSIWWVTPLLMFGSFFPCAFVRSRGAWLILLIGFPVFVNLSVMVNLFFPYLKLLEGLDGNVPNL